MKNIKKVTAIFLALTTLLFSFSLNGFAVEETEEESLSFSDIRLFKGRLVINHSGLDYTYEYRFVITHADGENEKICLESDMWDCICADEKTVIGIDNNMFDPFTTYRLYIYENEKEICMKEFVPVDIGATSLEFIYDNYYFEETDKLDLTEDILVPVNYNGRIKLSDQNTYCYSEPGGNVVSIDGFTVTAENHGYGYLCLFDENNNKTDEAWFQVHERTVDSFDEALKMSTSVFFESSLESIENFSWLAVSLGELVVLPFLVMVKILTIPFKM